MRKLNPILFILLLISCSNKPEIKRYLNSNFDESLSFIIDLNDFKSYGHLMNSIEKLACSDSITTLSFNGINNRKEIHVFEFCRDEMIIFDPKSNNTIYFINGNLIKNENIISIDSISYILNKDFKNFANNPNFADNPEKLLVLILNDENGNLKILKNFLDKITDAYDSIDTSESLKIMMSRTLETPSLEAIPNNVE